MRIPYTPTLRPRSIESYRAITRVQITVPPAGDELAHSTRGVLNSVRSGETWYHNFLITLTHEIACEFMAIMSEFKVWKLMERVGTSGRECVRVASWICLSITRPYRSMQHVPWPMREGKVIDGVWKVWGGWITEFTFFGLSETPTSLPPPKEPPGAPSPKEAATGRKRIESQRRGPGETDHPPFSLTGACLPISSGINSN